MTVTSPTRSRWINRVGSWLLKAGAAVVVVACAVWAFGAVWYDAPFDDGNKIAATVLAIAFVLLAAFVRRFWRKIGAIALLFALVLSCWWTLRPSENYSWQPDVAQKGWAEIR